MACRIGTLFVFLIHRNIQDVRDEGLYYIFQHNPLNQAIAYNSATSPYTDKRRRIASLRCYKRNAAVSTVVLWDSLSCIPGWNLLVFHIRYSKKFLETLMTILRFDVQTFKIPDIGPWKNCLILFEFRRALIFFLVPLDNARVLCVLYMFI